MHNIDSSPLMNGTFNHLSLGMEITKVWGAFGAHMDVFLMLLEQAKMEKPTLKELQHWPVS